MHARIRYGVALMAIALFISPAAHAADGQASTKIPDRTILTHGEHAHGYVISPDALSGERLRGTVYGYDVDHYDLDISIDFATPAIDATATMTVTITDAGLTQLIVDLEDDLTVTAASIDGVPKFWSQLEQQVQVNTGTPPSMGQQLDIALSYNGKPREIGTKSMRFRTHDGTPVVYTLSTPFSNANVTEIPISHYWRACKDDQTDKSTYSATIRVPDTMFACSNGLLTGEVDNLDGTKSYSWEHDFPVSPYLITLGATNYVEIQDEYVGTGGNSPVRHYAWPEDVANATTDWSVTVPALEVLSGLFGEYPFIGDKYGMYQISPGPAVEHQTMVSYPENIIDGTGDWDWLIAHEMAHMWWGDALTATTWDDVWLHEGFASYAEALWREDAGGAPALHAYMAAMDDGPYTGTIVSPPYVWNAIVYDKGAWVLHMLRHVFDDDPTFFQMLRDYRTAHEGGTMVTDDFIAAAETAYGGDLNWFFDQWLLFEGRPEYVYGYGAILPRGTGAGTVQIEVNINQVQSPSFPVYSMPIDIDVETLSGTESFVVLNTLDAETFVLDVSDEPISVTLDPGNWILGDFTEIPLDVAGSSVAPSIHLAPATPNPMTGSSSIEFSISRSTRVALRVFDSQGRMVRTLVQGSLDAGSHTTVWDGRDTAGRPVASGRYFTRLVSSLGVEEQALLVIR